MPELPDVAVLKRYVDSTALHQTIADVDVHDAQVLENTTIKELNSNLSGRKLSGTTRHGKYLFAHTDNDDVLVLHFGMTGDLRYYKDPDDEPEYTQILCNFDDGYHLAHIMTRKLGEVRLIDDVDAFIGAKELGPDVMADDFDFDTFRERLSGHHGMIKPRLMDQKIMAGLGNVYSDEILFQARVHPETPVEDLDKKTLRTIFEKMKSVLRTAIDHDADPEKLPDEFIIPQRHDGGTCPDCGGDIKHIDVSGRSAYYCPDCQKEP